MRTLILSALLGIGILGYTAPKAEASWLSRSVHVVTGTNGTYQNNVYGATPYATPGFFGPYQTPPAYPGIYTNPAPYRSNYYEPQPYYRNGYAAPRYRDNYAPRYYDRGYYRYNR